MQFNDQRIVEATDIARMLWLTRSQIWDKLDEVQRQRIGTWLRQANSSRLSYKNNWRLFPVVVQAFLRSTGMQQDVDYRSYRAFKGSSYRQAGWFSDGPDGPVDFYNAWGISYDLFWIHLMDPTLDPQFVRTALVESQR